MKAAKVFLCGVSALGLAVSGSFSSANEQLTQESDTGMSQLSNQPTQLPEDMGTFVVSEPMELSVVEVYDVDTDHDGKADSQLWLERSDTFVLMGPLDPTNERPGDEPPSGG